MRVTNEDRLSVTADKLAAALTDANIPTLVPVLYQLTGDRTWLSDQYRPTRTRGLDDHPTGGLDQEAQDKLRRGIVDAVMAWAGGAPITVPNPRGEQLVELMSICMGEEVPAEYEPMAAEDMGLVEDPVRTVHRDAGSRDLSVIIIGAGVSGLTMSRDLHRAGIRHVIFERNPRVGGTWLNNQYPGCGVDTPSYLYSFSFFQRDWSQHFAKRAELETYLSDMAENCGLLDNIRFGVEVIGAEWQEDRQRWTVVTRDANGEQRMYETDVLITAVGQLNQPKYPDIPGLDRFAGPVFHSARWPAGLDLTGKRVVVIGTGASSMQIVPAIVDQVAHVTIVQRSPQWVAPNDYYFSPIGNGVHYLMKHVPFYFEWYRFRLSWTFNDKVHSSLQKDPAWQGGPRSLNSINEGHRRYFERYMRSELDGRPDLIEKALPSYPPFGKRMLLDNGWFAALERPNVTLVTSAAAGLTETAVRTADGGEWPADIVVLATGFEAQRPTYPLELRGRGGATLREAWHDNDPRAYLGVATPGFPNLFFLYGPNTGLGHGGSFIFLAERASHYLTDLLCQMVEAGAATAEIKESENDAYNKAMDEAHSHMIWTQPGFTTWYANSRGRVVANMPWRVVDYWRMTQRADLGLYITQPPHAAEALTPGGHHEE